MSTARLVCVLSLCMALLCAAMPAAQVVQAKHARVELISRQESINPGHDLTLGVYFTLEKGWHIYWINPGDSGQPPAFDWQLPPGFNAGEIQWPRPDKLQNSPTLADYGYHHDVLLMVPVRGDGAVADKSLEVAVQAKWLICREVCIPDHVQLKLTVSHGTAGTNPRTARLFTSAEKQLPKSWPRSWTAMAESRKEDFLLTIKTGKPVSKAEFYPLDAGQIQNAAVQRVRATPQGCTVVLRKSDLLLKPVSALRGVLVLGDSGAYQLRAPVRMEQAVK
jgi:DsbC/DsbD-like thiol-disulfide interchange protein